MEVGNASWVILSHQPVLHTPSQLAKYSAGSCFNPEEKEKFCALEFQSHRSLVCHTFFDYSFSIFFPSCIQTEYFPSLFFLISSIYCSSSMFPTKYHILVFTKSVDSNFRAFWLDPVTWNILGYSLFCEQREKWHVVSQKFQKKKLWPLMKH